MQKLKIEFGKNVLYVDRMQAFAGNAYFNKRVNPNQEFKDLCVQLNSVLPTNFYDHNGAGKRVCGKLTEGDISKLEKFSRSYIAH